MVNAWTKFKDCESYNRDMDKAECKLKRRRVQTQIRLGLMDPVAVDNIDEGM